MIPEFVEFSDDIKVSTHSLIVVILGTLMSLFLLYNFKEHYIIILFGYTFWLLIAYNINCTIVGECKPWATILVILYVFKFCLSLYYINMIGIDKTRDVLKSYYNSWSESSSVPSNFNKSIELFKTN